MSLLAIVLALVIFPMSFFVPRWRGAVPAVLMVGLGLFFVVSGAFQAEQPNASYLFAFLAVVFANRAWRGEPTQVGGTT